MMPARVLHVSIARPAQEVYRFLSQPQNLPRWARSFCQSVRHDGTDWFVETPTGSICIRFAQENTWGILDHEVTLPDGQTIAVPMRVVANSDGCEVQFTLFRTASMSDEQFAEDGRMVERDLLALKEVLESEPSAGIPGTDAGRLE